MAVRADKGRLFYDFRWKGMRFREYVGGPLGRDTPANRKRLEKRFRLIHAQIDNDEFDYLARFPNGSQADRFREPEPTTPDESPTLSDYLTKWHAERSPYLPDGSVLVQQSGRKRFPNPSTWEKDGNTIRYRLIPELGELELAELSRARLLQYEDRLLRTGRRGGGPLRPKTVNNVMGVLHKALADAVEAELIPRNPCPRLAGMILPDDEPDPFESHDEIAALLGEIDPWWRGYYRVSFGTGWRPSVLTALRFTWLDWDHSRVSIRRSRYSRKRGHGAEGLPKQGRKREVYVGYDSGIFEVFREQLRRSLDVGKRDFVFFDKDGAPARSEDLHEYVWKPALRRAKLRYRVSYAMRHTFISHALMQGEPINWVAHVCGTSIAMIERHYEKWIPRDLGYGRRVAQSLFGEPMGRNLGRSDDVYEIGQEKYTTPTGFEPVLPA